MFTALLIAILIVGGVGGGLVGAIALSQRKSRALDRAAEPRQLTAGDDSAHLLERGVGDLRLGDVISRDERDWIVEGLLLYDEDGHRWSAGRLVDVDDERWLVVGMDRSGTASAQWLSVAPDIEVGSYPPDTIVTADKRFPLDKRGNATVKIVGAGGDLPGGAVGKAQVARCRWWRYQAPGTDCILIEDWGGDFRALRGQTLRFSDLGFMPGS